MDEKRKLPRKQIKKLYDAECYFCGEEDYALLDSHRIVPGSEGGKYTEMNMVTCCSNCHRRCHSGEIVIDRKYFSSTGKWVLHYFVNGEEKWK